MAAFFMATDLWINLKNQSVNPRPNILWLFAVERAHRIADAGRAE